MSNVEELEVFHLAHELALDVYKVTEGFPIEERFGLVAQMRRSAASIGSNLAEGSGRGTRRELQRFVGIALGSLNELQYQLRLAADLEMMNSQTRNDLRSKSDRVGRMLQGLRRYLRSKPATPDPILDRPVSSDQ